MSDLNAIRALLDARDNPGSTHYERCYENHIDCAARLLLERCVAAEQALAKIRDRKYAKTYSDPKPDLLDGKPVEVRYVVKRETDQSIAAATLAGSGECNGRYEGGSLIHDLTKPCPAHPMELPSLGAEDENI